MTDENYILITLDNFCTLFNNKSPCLITAWNWPFLWSGRLVSTIPPTRSILQWSRPAEMKRDNSLKRIRFCITRTVWIMKEALLVDVINRYSKRIRHVLQRQRSVRFQKLRICKDTHFSYVVSVMRMDQVISTKKPFNGRFKNKNNN